MNVLMLVAASEDLPLGLAALIADLGEGENGFGGTPVAKGQMSLLEYVRRCVEMTRPDTLPPGMVCQTVFWVLDQTGEAVGMVRIRHHLNDKLRERGGHIGYYIRRDRRGRGYGREMLGLALCELRKLGETRALLTVNLDNEPSVRLITGNGGVLDSIGYESDGKPFGRYWIDLSGPLCA